MVRRTEHVLIVGDFADVTGGQAKVAIESARLLADAGVKVTFFAACGPVSDLLSHPKISVICLNQKTILDDPNRARAMITGLWNASALNALRKAVRALDPAHAVIHCHGYAKALSPAIGRCLAQSPVPVVFTMHEYFLACPNGGFFDYRKGEICTLKPLGPRCLTTNCDVRRMMHKGWRVARGLVAAGPGRLPSGLRDIIYISETQRRAMAPHLPAEARLHHVSNPIANTALPVDARAQQDLVFVGRLSAEKGCVSLARVAAKRNFPVRFVGDGPEAAAIRAANPDAQITGWISPQDVQRHLETARAFVFPSLWYEGQPLAPIEALLRGIPVVCGRWNAAAENIVDGQNGVIYDAPTDAALASALERLDTVGAFDSAELAARVAPEAHLNSLLDIYDSLPRPDAHLT